MLSFREMTRIHISAIFNMWVITYWKSAIWLISVCFLTNKTITFVDETIGAFLLTNCAFEKYNCCIIIQQDSRMTVTANLLELNKVWWSVHY